MKLGNWLLAVVAVGFLSACATSHEIVQSGNLPGGAYRSAAVVPTEDNNEEMDGYLRNALESNDVVVKPAKPAGTKTANDVDLLVSYQDVWRWDLKTYLYSLRIDLFDGPTGALLATGTWRNSAFHGFQRGQDETRELLGEMIPRIRRGDSGK